jgi:hypothetical protein
MKQLELLSLENLLDINEQIKEDAKRDIVSNILEVKMFRYTSSGG